MTTEEVKKIEEILADEEFLKNLSEAKTDDEVKNLMATKGIIMTDQDMADYKKAAAETAEKLSKMTPEELENISGGTTVLEGAGFGAVAGAVFGCTTGAASAVVVYENLDKSTKATLQEYDKQFIIKTAACAVAIGTLWGAFNGAIGGAVGTAIRKQIDKLKNKSKQ